MQNSEQGEGEHEQQLDKIIAEYLQASDECRPLDRTDVLRTHPEFAAELREFFVDVGQFEKFAVPPSPDADETQPIPDSSSTLRPPGTQVRYFGDYTLYAHVGPVHWIDLSHTGDELASAGDDGTIRIWKAPIQ